MASIDRVVAERGVVGLAATACIRLRNAAGDVVGSGFLVGPDLVATCAHVAASAAGADPYAEAPPVMALAVDFPVLPGGPVARSARVHRWAPIAADGTGDVALLRLDAPTPPGAVMPPVRGVDELWDHRFRVFGFPDGRWDGVWATGRIRASQGTGWLQLQGTPGDQPIEGGFSGSPVWDDQTGAVVGMTVAADRDRDVTTAYLIPIKQVLGLDPELLPCPYRGLEPFGEEHAEYFFGRDTDVQRLRAALERCPLVAVAGPSGAGKSSLVRAGLLPGLRASGARIAEIRPRPGMPAMVEAVAAVLDLADPGSSVTRRARDAERICAALTNPDSRGAALEELTAAGADADADRLVLVVDQFEELAVAMPEAARELISLLADLAAAGGADAALRVALTVRGLALDEVLTPAVADALGSGTVLIGPLDRKRLREVVVRPAEHAPGLAFDDGLVDRILDDAGTEPGQLPLVESLLAQLWVRREGGFLTIRGYQAAGGVAGALTAHAERVIDAAFTAEGDLERLRVLCTRLAAPAPDGRFVRRPVQYSELPAELRALVPPLAAGRLVVVASGQNVASTVELAHQALIEHWPRLHDWLASDREFLAWRAELDAARERWDASGRDSGALLRGAALESADRWARQRPDELTETEIEYLQRSRARRRREVRRWRAVAAVLAVLVLTAGTLSIVAVRSGGQIASQQATANADRLGREAAARAQGDPVLAAQLALVAWRLDPNSAAARNALAELYLALASTQAVVSGTPGDKPIVVITTAGAAPDGVVLHNSDSPRVDVITDPTSNRPQSWPLPDPNGVDVGAFSPDGRRYLYRSGDGALRLWDIAANSSPLQLAAPGDEARKPASFSPDGSRLGWTVRDISGQRVLTSYDLATGATRAVPITLPSDEASVSLTADPDTVVVTVGKGYSPDAQSTLRSLARNAEVRSFPAGVKVLGHGTATLSCLPRDVRIRDSRSVLVISDLATGNQLRQMPLLSGTDCGEYRFTIDDRYVLEEMLSLGLGAQRAWRATELSSGRSYHFVTPPLDTSSGPAGLVASIAMLPGASGDATAFIAAGPTVLRLRTNLEVPADTGVVPPRRFLLAGGQALVTTDGTGRIASYNPVSGQTTATTLEPRRFFVLADEDLWALIPGPTRWELTRYAVPGLNPALQIALPTDPAGPPGQDGVNVVLNRSPGGPPETVLALVGGVLSAWNASTGQQLGQSIRLAESAEHRDSYRSRAHLWPRIGHPGQALVATPGDRVQLWDIPSGRMLSDLPISVVGRYAIAAEGDRLAALVRSGGTIGGIEVWNLANGQRIEGNIPSLGANNLQGFDAEGNLIGFHSPDKEGTYIVIYDLDRRGAGVILRPSILGEISVAPTNIWITGEAGRMPSALAATTDQWRDHLCRLMSGQLSPAARDLLPPGSEDIQPCSDQ